MKPFLYNINTHIKDDKRNITITDKKITKDKYGVDRKWYEYTCNKCENKDWIIESSLVKQKSGWNVCGKGFKKSKLGINTIWDKTHWMVDLGVSEEDAKKYTPQSNKKIFVTCSNCGEVTKKQINHIYVYNSISCTCSDKISYPNKFSYSLLDQLNEIYKFDYLEHEYSPEWIGNKSYDNYFIHDGNEYIVEMDGRWHNQDNNMSGQTKEESKEIDDYKDRLAKEHRIKVIRINCEESNLEFIKNNILLSDLKDIFNLNNIDWLQCEKFSLSNLVKLACDYKTENPKMTPTEIGKIMKLCSETIRRYLKRGNNLKWCIYTPKSIYKKARRIKIIKDKKILGYFKSCNELSRRSEELFGVKLTSSKISEVCSGKIKQHKGFIFEYIKEIKQCG